MSPSRNLESYRKKRDPERTPEPFDEGRPGPPAAGIAPGPAFVVQKHWARNLHYDLRLELDGTLKSWAVPKGPSTKAEEKRLAVHVEDHPLEYGGFEGVIPEKNYGAGSVIVWDRGWFRSFKPEDLLEQYERGKMELELFGFKLRGRWTLVRMGKKDKEWLLLKKVDGAASEREAIDRYPESVITGLTVEEMRDVPGTLAAFRAQVETLGAPRRRVGLEDVSLTLATLTEHVPNGSDWCFEIKYDGVRVVAFRENEHVRLLGRSGEDITARYPEVASGLLALPFAQFLLDGEIIASDEDGRPSFQRLQARMGLKRERDVAAAMGRVPVRAAFFDCMGAEGFDLRKVPLVDRKAVLSRLLPPLGVVHRVDHVLEHGQAFFDAASDLRLEGIVAKKLASTYSGRRTPDWMKIKCHHQQEFVIGGTTEPQGSRARFGALHVGVYDGDRLVYVTKVGTGFDGRTIDDVAARLEPLARATSPFDVDSPTGRGHRWFEPRLVCQVRFTEWTRAGGLRHPLFLGLREDVRPEDVRREISRGEGPLDAQVESDGEEGVDGISAVGDEGMGADGEPIDSKVRGDSKRRRAKQAPEGSVTRSKSKGTPDRAVPPPGAVAAVDRAAGSAPVNEVKLTNLKKVFWPDGTTKGDMIGFYETMAPLLLPYLRDRPLVLTRYPDGIHGKSFFQKDAPVFVPDWIRTEKLSTSDEERQIRYFVVDDVESLRYVANLGTIPLHVWSSRVGSIERPDWLIIDLDPKQAPFTHVIQVARTTHAILDELELPSYIKTSGASGLHVLVPMGQRYSNEEVRTFARLLAMLVVETVPEISTVTRAIQSREGKVYVDFGQNGSGNTIVAPYSVRPLPGAPASCPLLWKEVNDKLDPAHFTIRTIPPRFERMEDPMTPVLGEGADMAAAIERIERRMKRKRGAS